MGSQGLDCSPTSTCQWSQREKEGKTIALGFCSWRTSSVAWRTSWVREGGIEEKWLTKSWLSVMGLKCKRPSCCCCTLTLPLQNERATKTLSFSSGSTCSFKKYSVFACWVLLPHWVLERERMSYEEKERDGGNERDKHTESIRVFWRLLCVCFWTPLSLWA